MVIDTRLGEVGSEIARLEAGGPFGAQSLALILDRLYFLARGLTDRTQVVNLATSRSTV